MTLLMGPIDGGTKTSTLGKRRACTIWSATSCGSEFLTPRAGLRPPARSVFTTPGMTIEKSMPTSAFSMRTDSVRPTTACLVATYVAPPGTGVLPAEDATFTMWPVRRGRIVARAIFVPRITPWRLMSTWRIAQRSSSSWKFPTCMIPALLTRMSIGPRSRSTASTKAWKLSRLVTSSW